MAATTTDAPAPQGSATTTRSAPQLKSELELAQRHAGAAAREDRRQHGRRPGRRSSRRCSTARSTDLTIITGQKPLVTKAKKSIAGFKLREGNAIGAKVTLRGDRMWEFSTGWSASRSPASVTSGACRPNAFDGRGNYTFGVTEQLIFPEIDYDKIDTVRGHGHHDRHDRPHRRRGQGAARRLRLPVPP